MQCNACCAYLVDGGTRDFRLVFEKKADTEQKIKIAISND